MKSSLVGLLVLYFIIFYSSNKKKKIKIVKNHIKNKKSGKGKSAMRELSNRFIGKECVIQSLEGQIVGIIKQVSESGILIENSNHNEEIINLELVVSIKEFPRNKKGKKKIIV